MKKYNIAITFALLLIGILSAHATETRPNIVVILSDDAGYTDLGSFGGEIDTPNLDNLASQGLKLSHFYSNARCSPTRASLLSGVDAAHVGFGGGVVGDWVRELPFPAHRARLKYEQPIIPELLSEAGYHTMMAGKWHLGGSYIKDHQETMRAQWEATHPEQMKLTDEEMQQDYLALPPQRGFDESFVFHAAQGNLFFRPEEPQPYYFNNEKAQLSYDRKYDMTCYAETDFGKQHYTACDGKSGNAFYATDGITDEAISMIDAASKKASPFFMYVAYRAPHKPLQAPTPLVQKYLKRYANIQKVADERHAHLVELGMFPEKAPVRQSGDTWTSLPKEKIDAVRMKAAVHAAMMEKLDENVGRIIAQLKASGELENTLLVYLSDNGAASHIGDLMNQPYTGVKALLWEGGARTHAIIHWPKVVKAGQVTDDVVWVGDFLPTFLDVAEAEFPSQFRGDTPRQPDGRSIVPLLHGSSMPPPEALFFNDKGQQSVLYKGRWKLLIEPGWYLQTLAKPGIAIELYDLESDPGEVNNLASEKPKLVAQLVELAEAWKKENQIVDYKHIIKLKPQDPY
ncbi:sulfatase-like hydrolase/transferase [Aestuariibacter sp. A3R04]|uniref:sulfatase-like hydrolase/transferase n=1 Tax=Aestuariibacter sp. A3R04 TaxID=2841571 RepID=UPI001C0885D2|nr:sulfatase-like hydrolase/transferase [Aestuariibacter sp. A3R04]MBU3021277.1 sulfatase-like hydrolase/transferase [Aestuariibacter sp. A3R04]